MGADDSTQKKQLDLQNQMQAQQQAQESQLIQQNNAAFSPYLTGNVGFSPDQLAAMRTAALSQNAQKYNAANQQTNAMLTARGENGLTPLSGVAAGALGNLQSARAGDLADANRNIVLNNAQQALANKFNAGSVLSGNAQTYAGNVGTYGSGAANALNNVTQAQSNGFFNNFARGLGSGLAGGASAALTGGVGTAISRIGKAASGGSGGSSGDFDWTGALGF